MASESTEDVSITVELSGELDEWLDDRAARLGVSRDEVVRQLLSSYRAADDLGDDIALSPAGDGDDVVREEITATVDDRVNEQAERIIGDRLPDIADAVEGRIDADLSEVESEFDEKIDDVRDRVVQLKRELDQKAPKTHDHEAFEEIDQLDRELELLTDDLASFRDEVDASFADQNEEIADLADRLDDVEDKLKRVAWVVTDLREEQGGQGTHKRAVDRIKRAAAQEGISTASCESCDEQVDIALLTDPQCPHCETTVTDVRPDGGFLRKKARLVTASQLEAGETNE
ncbi:ribbon-helix-helix protein, CopG family [Haloarcula halophila]|uniref:ribbon-helix-helix protein, CopG family n=1 Tax=Haloarcula TaxID=2237 RepID=UPI0023E3F603|nr:ribbon-helix-helix protein, CopG family [Halomicroarcula sp. DFY41]